MKKIIMLLTVAAMLATSVIGVSAYAPEDGKYNVTYADEKIQAGEYYGIVVVKGTTASTVDFSNLNNILYIDQVTASTDGSITIPEFATKGVAPGAEGFEEGTIFIGGTGFGTATSIGHTENVEVEEPEDPKYTISGTVTDTVTVATSSKKAMATLYNAEGETVDTAEVTEGAYSFANVVAGEGYKVVINKDSFCEYTFKGISVANNVILDNADLSEIAGDVDGNGEVMLPDIQAVTEDFYATSATAKVPAADVDGNGEVMLPDIQKITDCFYSVDVEIDLTPVAN